LAERGLDISYETVRRSVLKFGPAIARRLCQRRPRPSDRWHLDEKWPQVFRSHLSLALASATVCHCKSQTASGRQLGTETADTCGGALIT